MTHLRFFLVIIIYDFVGHRGIVERTLDFHSRSFCLKSMLWVPIKSSLKQHKIGCQMYGAFMHSIVYFLTFVNKFVCITIKQNVF